MILLFLSLLAFPYASCLKVLIFEEPIFTRIRSLPTGVILSSASDEDLPDSFVLCSSHKQKKVDGKTPFTLYGEDGSPWLAFSIWLWNSKVVLFADVQRGTWLRFHEISPPWTHVWLHVCAAVDTMTGNLTLSLNGKEAMTKHSEKLKTNKPPLLNGHLSLGMTNSSRLSTRSGGIRQFYGSITNLNILLCQQRTNVQELTKKPCYIRGDFLAWSDMRFSESNNFKMKEVEWECEEQENMREVRLPIMTSWLEANKTCTTLGNGHLSQLDSKDNKQCWSKRTERIKPEGICNKFWLPISDDAEEGFFRNTVTKKIERLLPWKFGAAQGGRDYNFVGMAWEGYKWQFHDLSGNESMCVVCDICVKAIFKLRGLCTTSFFGKSKTFCAKIERLLSRSSLCC